MSRDHHHHRNLKFKPVLLALCISSFLVLIKLFSGLFCSSKGLLASALDSLMDATLSAVNLITIKKSSEPPDKEHAYGHGKIESIASYTQGLLILFFAGIILYKSLFGEGLHSHVTHSGIAIIVIIISALMSLLIAVVMSKAEKQSNSLILKAELAHYLMDFLSYFLILIALILVKFTGWNGWDILAGIIVSLYVGYFAVQILIRAGKELIDASLPEEDVKKIKELIMSHHNAIHSFHELRTRRVGEEKFADFHLVFQEGTKFEEAHDVSDSLRLKIKSEMAPIDITIHEDPYKDQI